MKELFVVYEYEKISFLVALKTPQKSEKSMGETSRLRSESLALSQFSEISFLAQLANKKSHKIIVLDGFVILFLLFCVVCKSISALLTPTIDTNRLFDTK